MWNTVRLTPRQWNRSIARLKALSVSINVDADAGGLRYGQTLWAGDCDGQSVGLAWDWREVRPDVIAMSDPMTVLSNLRLVDDAGVELDDSRRLMCLNTTIYQLHWQERLRARHDGEHYPLAA